MAFDPAWVSGYPGHSPVISVLKNDNTTEAVSLNPKQNWKLPMAETLTAYVPVISHCRSSTAIAPRTWL
eukprot:scaffold975_cov398-Prasinococcus_capsulatus_cf.AAC.7